jgi:threonyl-tRNA synthetase
MTREQIEERMNELARKYLQTHDSKIPYVLYELARELEKMEKKSEATKWKTRNIRKRKLKDLSPLEVVLLAMEKVYREFLAAL